MASLEERKRAFLAAKDSAGGAESLALQQKTRPFSLYFDANGDITCFSNGENVVPQEGWLTHDFTREQLEVLVDRDLTKYRVRKDPKIDNLYSIELRPLESVYVKANDDFLYEISDEGSDADLICKLTDTHLVIRMSKKAKSAYKGIYPISATVKGQRLLKFYVTAKNDPHVMYHYTMVSLADLLSEKEIKSETEVDLRGCSIFTIKLFDTYGLETAR